MDEFLVELYLDRYNYLRALTVTFGSLRLQEWLAFLPLMFPPMLLEVRLEVIGGCSSHGIWSLPFMFPLMLLEAKLSPGLFLKFQSFPPYVGGIKKGKILSSSFLFLQINTF